MTGTWVAVNKGKNEMTNPPHPQTKEHCSTVEGSHKISTEPGWEGQLYLWGVRGTFLQFPPLPEDCSLFPAITINSSLQEYTL